MGLIFFHMVTSSNGRIPRYWPVVRDSHVAGAFRSQRAVMRSIDVFCDLRLNKRLSKQSWWWWFETPSRSLRRHYNEIYAPACMYLKILSTHLLKCRKCASLNLANIGSSNGFVAKPLSEPMLTFCKLNLRKQIPVTFESKHKCFHPWKCIWKCRLRNRWVCQFWWTSCVHLQ